MFGRNLLSVMALGAFVALATGSGDSSEDEWDEIPAGGADSMNAALWPAEEAAPAAPAKARPAKAPAKAQTPEECAEECMRGSSWLGGPDYPEKGDECTRKCGWSPWDD